MTAQENMLRFYDIRKPSLILTEMPVTIEKNDDEVNDLTLQVSKNGIMVAACDDSGATIVHDLELVDGLIKS